jgi:hypothetical protein
MEVSGLSSLHKLLHSLLTSRFRNNGCKDDSALFSSSSMARGNKAKAKTKIGQTYYLAKKPEG